MYSAKSKEVIIMKAVLNDKWTIIIGAMLLVNFFITIYKYTKQNNNDRNKNKKTKKKKILYHYLPNG